MKKIILGIMMVLLLTSLVYALDECGEAAIINTECSVVTPYISYCSDYVANISYSNGTSFFNATLSQIGSTGIYNFTINFTGPDTYIIKLCDDSVRTVVALDDSNWTVGTSLWSYILQIYHYVLEGGY